MKMFHSFYPLPLLSDFDVRSLWLFLMVLLPGSMGSGLQEDFCITDNTTRAKVDNNKIRERKQRLDLPSPL